jgi:hypothetical protein
METMRLPTTDGLTSADVKLLTASATHIRKTFAVCPAQTVAHNVIKDDVLHVDIEWTSTTGADVATRTILPTNPQHMLWLAFMTEMMLEIDLVGYAVYGVTRVKRKNGQTVDMFGDFKTVPTVKSSQAIYLQWDTDDMCYYPYDLLGNELLEKDGWHLLMVNPPIRFGPNNFPVFHSSASRCEEASIMMAEMKVRAVERDRVNTKMSLYVNERPGGMTGPGVAVSAKPWITPGGVNPTGAAYPDMYKPTETIIDDTRDGIYERIDMTRDIRKKMGAKRYSLLDPHEPVDTSAPEPAEHVEHITNMGFDSKEVSFRQAPADMLRIQDGFTVQIMLIYGMMPHVIGKSLNSERNAASPLTTEEAIERHKRYVRMRRNHIQMAVTTVSRYMSGSPTCTVVLKPCVSIQTLREIEGVLKIDVLHSLMACVHNRPVEDFDAAKIATKQELILYADKPAVTRDKPDQTNDQKQSNLKAKSQKIL